MSTPPIRRCASPTCPPARSSPVRTAQPAQEQGQGDAGPAPRLFEAQREAAQGEEAEARKAMVGSGDRSERIRTYNFPQGRVTDHRINLTLHRLPEMLEGPGWTN
jgi:hypothetical protein